MLSHITFASMAALLTYKTAIDYTHSTPSNNQDKLDSGYLKILNNQEAEVMNVCNKKDTQIVLLKILDSPNVVCVDGKHLEVMLRFGI